MFVISSCTGDLEYQELQQQRLLYVYLTSNPLGVPIDLTPLKTYQTECWDAAGTDIPCAGSGQDGEYQAGREADFSGPIPHDIYSDDYTTTDHATQLVWKTCSEGLSGAACDIDTASTRNWDDAQTTCDGLNSANDGSGYAGRSDWRLPAAIELETLIHYATTDAAKTFTEHFPATVANYYWSSTEDVADGTQAWRVGFDEGYVRIFDKTTLYPVRCVSPGSFSVATSYTDNGDGTVTDTATDLTWQKCSYGQTNDATCSGSLETPLWEDALAYCNDLDLAGRSDWRLPNINELKSIVDRSTDNPAIDSNTFPATTGSYWSSSTSVDYTDGAWRVDFSTVNVAMPGAKINTSYTVRCVSD